MSLSFAYRRPILQLNSFRRDPEQLKWELWQSNARRTEGIKRRRERREEGRKEGRKEVKEGGRERKHKGKKEEYERENNFSFLSILFYEEEYNVCANTFGIL